MKTEQDQPAKKAEWAAPEIVSHGNIESITGWTGHWHREMFCGPGRRESRCDYPNDRTGS